MECRVFVSKALLACSESSEVLCCFGDGLAVESYYDAAEFFIAVLDVEEDLFVFASMVSGHSLEGIYMRIECTLLVILGPRAASTVCPMKSSTATTMNRHVAASREKDAIFRNDSAWYLRGSLSELDDVWLPS